jgi:hypothetical protein
MADTYTCDHCGATAESLDDWQFVVVGFFHVAGGQPPPGGKTLDATLPDLVFDTQACLDAWRAEVHLTAPRGATDA